MKSTHIENLIKKHLITHIENSEELKGRYNFLTIRKELGDNKLLSISGLFPVGFSEDEAIRLKYLRGKHKRMGAIATISPELEIKEGVLADCIRLFKLNNPSDPYIFRLYSFHLLHKKRLFRDGAISIYPNSCGDIEDSVLEMIGAIEEYFIKPQSMIYRMSVNLLEYIDKNHQLFTYPFLTKILIYLKNTENINDNEMHSLANKRFSDYKYRTQIMRIVQTSSIYNLLCDNMEKVQ